MAILKDTIIQGNANITGDISANTIKKIGGTSSQFLKANGDVDSTAYISTAGTGLSKSGNTLNHSNSITAGTAGTPGNTSGNSLTVPFITYDGQGHITGWGTRTHNIGTLTNSSQTNTTTNSDYRVLFSNAANDSTENGTTRKSTNLKFNPSTGILTVTGKVNASSGFFQTSDINKKNIISDLSLEKAYELIDKCQTIIYTLKDDNNNKLQVGMIALEIQQIFPELVTENNGELSLDYSRLTVIIFKVLKDLINRIEKLEK